MFLQTALKQFLGLTVSPSPMYSTNGLGLGAICKLLIGVFTAIENYLDDSAHLSTVFPLFCCATPNLGNSTRSLR